MSNAFLILVIKNKLHSLTESKIPGHQLSCLKPADSAQNSKPLCWVPKQVVIQGKTRGFGNGINIQR